MSSSCGSSKDQSLASGDAGTAEIAGDFLMDVHGMKECSRAMQEGDERQGYRSVPVRLAAKLRGQAPLQEFERRHVFFAGESDGPIFRNKAVIIGMGDKEVENAAASLRGRGRRLDGREEIQ